MTTQSLQSLIFHVGQLVEQRTGLAAHKQMGSAFDDAVLSLAGDDLPAYIHHLENAPENDKRWQALVNTLTIGETYFLRDSVHFDLLRNHLLSSLIIRRRARGERYLNIWSVGCATGEEPYSLAITLYEMLPDVHSWTIQLLGTDINSVALHGARRGVYRKWAFRHTELDFQQLYFDPVPDGLLIKPHIRQMVTFRHANLFRMMPLPAFDLILCRNVLLYFDAESVQKAEGVLHNALAPGGWLLLSQSEMLRSDPKRWIIHTIDDATIYQKPSDNGHPLSISSNGKQNGLKATNNSAAVKKPASLYEEAVAALQGEAYEEATRLLEQLIAASPEHAAAHVLLASLLANRQQIAQAHLQVDTALQIDPLQADAYYLKALLFLEQERNEEAYRALNTAIYCQRSHALSSFMLGNIHARAGEITRAMRHWENARHAISSLTPDVPISDISHITVGQLTALVNEQIEGWDH